MTPTQVVDYLTYANYAHNRRLSPEISPERWAKIYPDAAKLEAKFQADQWIASLNLTTSATFDELRQTL